MARIQILQLPEGVNDERPPFALVVDQATETTRAALDLEVEAPVTSPLEGVQRALRRSLADLLGARAVLVFEETVEIGGDCG